MFARLPITHSTLTRLAPLLPTLAALLAVAALVLVVSPSARAAVSDLLGGTGVPPGLERAQVARVVDGDTVVLADGRTVRVLGIDTPETHNPNLAGPQPLGAEAAARMTELVEGKMVGLERDVTDRDHYGRWLRHLWLGRRLVAEQLVREGLGRADIIPPDHGHAEELHAAEGEAHAAGRGVWGLPRPTPLAVFGTAAP